MRRLLRLLGLRPCDHHWERWGAPVVDREPDCFIVLNKPTASQRRRCTTCGKVQQRAVGTAILGDAAAHKQPT